MLKTIFINTHPIQYFAPLYRYLNDHSVPTECWYCSDENVNGHLDRQFGAHVEWDIPILQGYPHRFFKNTSKYASLYNGFFGLWNPGMIRALFKEPPATIVVHGWSYKTHVMVLIFARFAGHKVCLRGENPLNQEMMKSTWLRVIKRICLQWILFRFIHCFLYIGSQNKGFYQYYGVKDRRLISTPYAVDNERFRKAAEEMAPFQKELRQKLGLPAQARIVLFTAKFIQKKRPMDLLKAYAQLSIKDKCLVMVGDGELRARMEKFIRDKGLQQVFLTGFINQSEIVKYYAVADVFVLCSGVGETWGLSVNEAMNFDLPIIASDVAGCSTDLLVNGRTGFISVTGDSSDLGKKISAALDIGKVSHDVLREYSFEAIARGLRKVQEL